MATHDHDHAGSELSETQLRVRALETILTEKGYVEPAALDAIIETYETKIGPRNGARVVAKAWTDPAFKKALLAASSVAFLPASAAGGYVTKVFERLGISEEMKAKTKTQAAPAQIAPAVAKGEAELGVFLSNVLIAPGVELVGPFPGDLQQELVFTSAIAADTKEAEAAKALVDYLRTPAATALIKAAGMTPG